MRRASLLLILPVCLLSAPRARAAAPTTPAAPAHVVDGIAAQVGNDIILLSDVNAHAAPLEAKLRKEGASDADIAQLRSEVLNQLIDRQLLREFAKRAEIDASDSEVDKAIAAIAKGNGLTVEQVRKSVEAQGLSYADYQDRIRQEILQQKVMSGAVAPRVHVPESEVRALYQKRYGDQPKAGEEEVHLRDLLVKASDRSESARADACRTVGEVRDRVRGGEPLAKAVGVIPSSVQAQGGDLGWIRSSELADWMAPAVASLSDGEISDPIQTSFGCALLELVARRKTEPVTFAQAKSSLEHELFQKHFEKEYEKFIDKLRSQTYIARKGVFAKSEPALGSAAPAPRPLDLDVGGPASP